MSSVLFIYNESSGTSITNYGDTSTAATIDANGTPQYTWNQDSGSYDGFLTISDHVGSNMTWIDMDGITMDQEGDINLAIGFSVSAYDTSSSSQGWLKTMWNSANETGGMSIKVNDPSTTGDYNLELRCQEDDATPDFQINGGVFADLSFSTIYLLSMSIDVSAPRFAAKLDSQTVAEDTAGGGSFSSNYWRNHAGHIGRGNFAGNFGVQANLYYFFEERGSSIAWGDSDLANVNSDPAGNLTGWPSSGGGALPLLSAYYHG